MEQNVIDYQYQEKVFVTNNYDKFKKLLGNRDVTPSRVNKIKSSIEAVGYISNPILVNEKMEIVDGQGRVDALKDLNMPVEYRIVPNIGLKECRKMNEKNTNWTVTDFIHSYIDSGNENYINLKKLHNDYGFGYSTLIAFITSSYDGCNSNHIAKEGKLKLPFAEYIKWCDTLEYLDNFRDAFKSVGGREAIFYGSILFVSTLEYVDKQRLIKTVNDYHYKFVATMSARDFIEQICEYYYKGLSKSKRESFTLAYDKRKVDDK